MMKTLFGAATFAAAAALAAPAGAVVATPSTYETYSFVGVCSDCTGDVGATLVLQNYTGGTFYWSDFVSFTYGGSNLQPWFTLTPGDVTSVAGDFQALPGADYFSMAFTLNGVPMMFSSDSSGVWSLASREPADAGVASSWNTVQEPSTWAMLLIGFAGLAYAGARGSRSGRAAL